MRDRTNKKAKQVATEGMAVFCPVSFRRKWIEKLMKASHNEMVCHSCSNPRRYMAFSGKWI